MNGEHNKMNNPNHVFGHEKMLIEGILLIIIKCIFIRIKTVLLCSLNLNNFLLKLCDFFL